MTEKFEPGCRVDMRLRPEPPDRIDWLHKRVSGQFVSPCFHWPGEPFPYEELDRWAKEEVRKLVGEPRKADSFWKVFLDKLLR
jgi:hypothetical protein